MKKSSLLILAATAILAACTVESIETLETGVVEAEDQSVSMDSCYEPGVVVVKFTEEMAALIASDVEQGSVMTKSTELNDFVQAYGITSIERVFTDDERWIERQHREGLHLWYQLTYDPDLIVTTKAANELSAVPGVQIAEPSPKIKPLANFFNDTYYSTQWAYNGTYNINTEAVWQNYTVGDSQVIVGVVDGGIDPNHPDLVANLIPAGVGGSKNFITGNYAITGHEHGTHVGGIISAVSNNGIGVAGIAGGDYASGIGGVQLLNCQVFSSTTQASNFADAIKYAADNGALICQNSWGYSYETEEQAKAGSTPAAMATAIDYFVKYAGCDNSGEQLSNSLMKGGVVIFAAGNDGWQYGHPADYEACIAVGATTSNGLRADYSNYGDWVDICAPGSEIYSTYYSSGSSTYSYMSGTSMACPMVSGVAALVLSYQGGYGFTADQLKECLLEGAAVNKVSAQNVGPYLDALGSVTYGVQDPPQNVDSYSVTASGNTIYFTWNVPAGDSDGTVPAYGMLLCASTNKSSIDGLKPRSPSSDVQTVSVLTDSYNIGDEVTAGLTVDNFNTAYYVTCVPFNYGSRYADAADTKSISTGANNPPTITPSIDVDNLEVRASKSVSVTFDIVDPDAHDVTVEYSSASIAEKWSKTTDTRYVLTITGYATDESGNYVTPGTYRPTIRATDSYGAATSLRFAYTIVDNEAPVIGQTMENVLLFYSTSSTSGRSAEIALGSYFSDPDGDEISYTVQNSSSSTVAASVGYDEDGNATLYLTAMAVGSASITVVASDARGLSCSQTFSVTVRSESDAVSVYPNPVSDILYVSTGADEVSTQIKVSSTTGATVYDQTSNVSAFKPAAIDVSGFAPGTYNVRVKFGSTDVTKKVVKI